MSTASGSADDLQKLTVAQLKTLCKEKNLVGYSKLTKHAIILKLTTNEDHIKPSSTKSTATLLDTPSPQTRCQPKDTATRPRSDEGRMHQPLAESSPRDTNSPSPISMIQQSIGAGPHVDHIGQPFRVNALALTNDMVSTTVYEPSDPPSKRIRELSGPPIPISKKRKVGTTLTPVIFQAVVPSPSRAVLPTIRTSQLPGHSSPSLNPTIKGPEKVANRIMGSVAPQLVRTPQDQTVPTTNSKSKRFIPLIIQKSGSPSLKNSFVAHARTPVPISKPSQKETKPALSIEDLDFTVFTSIPLQPVSYPPSLSQRKSVPNLALFLSAVSVKDLSNCTCISRLFRYAIYISAVHRLRRDFPGRRLDSILQQYSPNMTNMWPYLRQREAELYQRKRIYRESFLNRALKGYNRVSDRLWTSPDNPKQVTIAIRFLLTHLYFSISVAHETSNLFKGKIVDAQEVVPGELWSIEVSSPELTDVYYVLEATCEVVGRPSPHTSTPSPLGPYPIRADWSAYVNAQSSSPSSDNVPLISHLKWTNHEEYDRGISRVWLKRTQDEGKMGEIKRVVAERYILACLVANSVSGPWMTSLVMAQEFDGMSPCLPKPTQKMRVQLFLPAHHHIESLHFTTSKGEPLHPALAAVQTPGREYYIFRDNGMQVGCEEEGVARVWMQILECNANGRPNCT